MATLFQSLLNRLNSIFSKDPRKITAFQLKVGSDAQLTIQDRQLTVNFVNTTIPAFTLSLIDPYDSVKSISISSLYNQLQADTRFTVSSLNSVLANLGAIALVEGTYNLSANVFSNISAATSILWAIFRPLAYVLEKTKDDTDLALQQLQFVTATGDFLDYWGSVFGIPRYIGEPDNQYSIRLLWETVKPRLNNKALENIIIQGLGFDANVVDMSSKLLIGDGFHDPIHTDPSLAFKDPLMIGDSELNNTTMGFANDTVRYGLGNQFTFASIGMFVEVPLVSKFFQYTEANLQDLTNRHRAAGTTPWFFVTQTASEIYALINQILMDLEGAIDQEISDGRVMFFGYDDNVFYGDHWDASNIVPAPFYQNNLNVPSLGDGLVFASSSAPSAPVINQQNTSYFLDGSLGDGALGSFSRSILYGDGAGESDLFLPSYRNIEYVVIPPVSDYIYQPVVLKYQRVSDAYITPRVIETLGSDVMTKTTSQISGNVVAWEGSGVKQNVASSGTTVINTPIRLISPVNITGLHFDEVALEAANINTVPMVIRNLDISTMGDNWNNSYATGRTFILPIQDDQGNVYYHQMEIPFYSPPPVDGLRIVNPTATIQALSSVTGLPQVWVVNGGSIRISWAVTNPNYTVLTQTILSTGISSSTVVAPSDNTTFINLTEDTEYTISTTGLQGQLVSASVVVRVVANAVVAVAPTINATVFPDVVELCSTNITTVQYDIVFNSKQTETNSLLFPLNADSFTLSPLNTDPTGTVIVSSFVPLVNRVSDGLAIEGGWTGLDTASPVFVPLYLNQAQGQILQYVYNVNYGGNSLFVNGSPVDIGEGEVFSISQSTVVALPPPTDINVEQTYSYTISIQAGNYASQSSVGLPVVVQPIQESNEPFNVLTINPTSVPEAYGPTVSETPQVTITGTGFSSKMQVWLAQKCVVLDKGIYNTQWIQANVISVDWINNVLTFVAPPFQYGTYPIRIVKLNCAGEILEQNDDLVLTYNVSTFRDPPFVTSLSPSAVCTSVNVSQLVTVTGVNFRPGAIVYMLLPTGPLAMATTYVSSSVLVFTMNQNTTGDFDIMVYNLDGSSGATTTQPLHLVTTSSLPVVNQFGYVVPTDPVSNCVYPGTPFTLYWQCSNCSYVNFSSTDPKVLSQLTDDTGLTSGFPPTGSALITISDPPVTITMTAESECQTTSISQTVTVSSILCQRVIGISIRPAPIEITQPQAYKVQVLKHTIDNNTGEEYFYDISTDPALVLQLVDSNNNLISNSPVVSLTANVLVPLANGQARISATWNGYYDAQYVFVEFAYPVSLTITPSPLIYSNIGETYQLTVIANYSDGSTADITNSCVYRGYNPSFITVSTQGLVKTKALGYTIVNCVYTDKLSGIPVTGYVAVSTPIPDGCLSISRFYIDYPYILKPQNVNLTLWSDNTKTATLNGISVYNGVLNENFQYTTVRNITNTQKYTIQISNNTGMLSATAIANYIVFPKVIINKFTCKAEMAAAVEGTAINVHFNCVAYINWSVSNAVSVTLSEVYSNKTYTLADAGSIYLTQRATTNYVLTATGIDGTVATANIHIYVVPQTINDANFPPVVCTPEFVRLGQSCSITFPAPGTTLASTNFYSSYPSLISGLDNTVTPQVVEYQRNNRISTDGTSPIVDGGTSFPVLKLQQSDTPSTNSIYSYYLKVTGNSTALPTGINNTVYLVAASAANVDPGPNFVYAVATPNTVIVGQPVTITYHCTGAATITGNFVNNQKLPLGISSFVVYPDVTQDFVLTATSILGLVATATIHVNVLPQVLSMPCSLVNPHVTDIAVDGINSKQGFVNTVSDVLNIHTLEIFGSGFLGGRTPNPQIIGQTQVIISDPNNTASEASGLQIVSINSVTDTYILCKFATENYTKPGNYIVQVLNDGGISHENGCAQSFNIGLIVPQFIMNSTVSGQYINVYVDYVDSTRDSDLRLLIGGVELTPVYIGSNLDNVGFVTDLYIQAINRDPTNDELNTAINNLESGSLTRYDIFMSLLKSPEYIANSSPVVAVGTQISAIVMFAVNGPVALTLRTKNGISSNALVYAQAGVPPRPLFNSNCPIISYLTPTAAPPGTVISVVGSNFSSGATIYLGDSATATTFIDTNHLSFVVPDSLYSYVTSVSVSDGTCVSAYNSLLVLVPDSTQPNDPLISSFSSTLTPEPTVLSGG